jgi:hypothetical protein
MMGTTTGFSVKIVEALAPQSSTKSRGSAYNTM